MTALNYYQYLEKIAQILADPANTATKDFPSFVETNPQFDLQALGKCFWIELKNRRPAANQYASAGKRKKYSIYVSVKVIAFNAESFAKAAKDRDDLLGSAELVLMADPSLGNTCNMSWLEGGEFQNASGQFDFGQVFTAIGEILVRIEADAINP